MTSYAVILLAAGKSSRFKDREKKPYADLDGRAVWLRSLELFSVREDIRRILIVVSADDRELFDRRYRANVAFLDNARVVEGGDERVDSVEKALAHCDADVDFVAIHDAARACVTADMVEKVFAKAAETGAAILAAPVSDTLKRVDEGEIRETVPRTSLWAAQTPQVFRRDWLLDAYANRSRIEGPITDDAQLVEAAGRPVAIVECDRTNLKITTKADLALASAILKSRPARKSRDVHPFGEEQMWK